MFIGVAAIVGMGFSVAARTEVVVSGGSTGSGEAARVGAGATMATVLQADMMKAVARAIPINLRNIFLVTIIHTLSLSKSKRRKQRSSYCDDAQRKPAVSPE